MVPREEVATSLLFASVAMSELAVIPVNQVEPELVNAVVLAPPFIEKRPVVMVEEAFEIKPFVNVPNPVNVEAPVTARVPPKMPLPVVVKLPTTVEEACDR